MRRAVFRGAPVGLVPAIDALPHGTFEAAFAREPMEGRAATDLVIAVPEHLRRPGQQRFQPGLALDQPQRHQVLAV
jgi:hypothetical protein